MLPDGEKDRQLECNVARGSNLLDCQSCFQYMSFQFVRLAVAEARHDAMTKASRVGSVAKPDSGRGKLDEVVARRTKRSESALPA